MEAPPRQRAGADFTAAECEQCCRQSIRRVLWSVERVLHGFRGEFRNLRAAFGGMARCAVDELSATRTLGGLGVYTNVDKRTVKMSNMRPTLA
jgi:hypothetical protein